MKRFNITLLFIFFITVVTKAQYYEDISGRTIMVQKYTDVQGFPYLYNDWNDGIVLTEGGKTFNKLRLKYDLIDDIVYFKSDNGETMAFKDPIKSFVIDKDNEKNIFMNGYPSVDKYSPLSYYQIIFGGKLMSLLFKNTKYISETTPYNSATSEKKFIQNNIYYLFKDGKMEKFKPLKKDILTLFSDKSDQLNDFIKSANIDFKNNADLAKIFDFYYSLK